MILTFTVNGHDRKVIIPSGYVFMIRNTHVEIFPETSLAAPPENTISEHPVVGVVLVGEWESVSMSHTVEDSGPFTSWMEPVPVVQDQKG